MKRWITVDRLVWFGLVLLLVLALVAQTRRGRRLLEASRQLQQVEQVTLQMSARGQLVPELLRANLDVLRQAADNDPRDVRIPLAAAGQHLVLGHPQRAIEVYEQALDLEPRVEIYLNLGRAYQATGDRAAARRNFASAITLDPNLVRVITLDMLPDHLHQDEARRRQRQARRDARTDPPPR